jgi:hypothetical protein
MGNFGKLEDSPHVSRAIRREEPGSEMTSGLGWTITPKGGHSSSQNIFFSYYAEKEALARFRSNDLLSHHTAARYV